MIGCSLSTTDCIAGTPGSGYGSLALNEMEFITSVSYQELADLN